MSNSYTSGKPIPAGNAVVLPGDFQDVLDAIGASDQIGPWRREIPDARDAIWDDGAFRLADMEDGANILSAWVSNAHRADFQVRYAGESRCDHGARFYAFHFQIAEQIDFVVWVEDDGCHSLTVVRGEESVFSDVKMLLMLSEGFVVDTADDRLDIYSKGATK